MRIISKVLLLFLIFSILPTMSFALPQTMSKELQPSIGERAEAYYKNGYQFYTLEKYKEAIVEYGKALDLAPDMAKAHYWLAKCYYKLSNLEKSAWQCNAALQVDSTYEEPKNLLQIIEKRKASIVASKAKPKTLVTETKPPAQPPPPPPPPLNQQKVEQRNSGLLSLDLRDVEISHAMRILSKESGRNIVVSKDVEGRITVSLSNVTFDDAFNAILKASSCIAQWEGDIIKVLPSGEPAKIIRLSNGNINKTVTINYVNPDDIKETLTKFVPDNTKVITTKGSKYIVLEGPPDSVAKVEKLIKGLDTPPKQVMVEAKIIEIAHTDKENLGVNMKWTNPNNATETLQTKGLANPSTATGATGLYYSVTNQNIEALVEALQTKTGYNLLSSPKVMTLNEQKAEIITGQRLGYKVKTFTETTMMESVEFLDVGTKLVITPSIKDDGYMMMDIHPEISEGSIVNDLPQKKSTETTTKLLVKDGQTIILGGLMKEYSQEVKKGVPFLMDIPFLGTLFRRTDIENEKREIIILMSPHIITPAFIEGMGKPIKEMEKKFEKYETPTGLVK